MTLLDLRVESQNGVVVARLDGEIDMSNAARLGASLSGRVTRDAFGLAVNLTAVRYLDSAGVRAVFELREQLTNRGQDIRLVVRPGSAVAKTLELVDASKTIGIVETTDAAVEALTAQAERAG
jgi:anti-sigma B factor antagonist